MTDNALTVEDIDRLGQTVISLTKELWVLKDRQLVLEAALAESGLLKPGAIDAFAPDEKLTKKLADERRRLLDGVLGTLTAPPRN